MGVVLAFLAVFVVVAAVTAFFEGGLLEMLAGIWEDRKNLNDRERGKLPSSKHVI